MINSMVFSKKTGTILNDIKCSNWKEKVLTSTQSPGVHNIADIQVSAIQNTSDISNTNSSLSLGDDAPADCQFSDCRYMPSYTSQYVRDKSAGAILQKMEAHLRNPFLLDMDLQIQAVTELQFSLETDPTPALTDSFDLL